MHKQSRKKTPRTQEQRRRQTVTTLVDAAIKSLLTVGYSRTTVVEVCRRAGLSHGALFRFFPSMVHLVVAAAEETATRQIAAFEASFAKVTAGENSIDAALTVLRDVCRSPTQIVYQELLTAARTDAVLRKALKPSLSRHLQATRAAARRVRGVEDVDLEILDAVLFAVIYLFDAEALMRSVFPQPNVEDRRLALLKAGVQALVGSL